MGIVAGGYGSDSIQGGNGNDIILGDTGEILFDSGLVITITTSNDGAGNDVISTGAGDDIVFGGLGNDNITIGSGNNAVVSDNGQADYLNGVLIRIQSSDVNGGADTILALDGDNAIIGGAGVDTITGASGVDIILADNGVIEWTAAGIIHSITALNPDSNDYADIVNGGDGDNIILGGYGDDTIQSGSGNDLILGDTGEILFNAGLISSIKTSNDGAGNDVINSGAGDDTVLAGLGNDLVDTGAGDDLVIADTGSIENNPVTEPAILIKNDVDPSLGGDDIVYLGEGNDMALGGDGADFIDGQGGDDAIFGDFVEISITRSGVRDFQSTLATFGGDDTIVGGPGLDILVGGSGSDLFVGSLSEDIIIGNYARIVGTTDFNSLLVVSDPLGREIISSSMFNIYGNDDGSQVNELSSLFSDSNDENESLNSQLRTDTALRLMPLLNGDELSKLSDNELKDFLRSLPLLTEAGSNRHGHMGSAHVPDDEPSELPEEQVPGDDLAVTPSVFNIPLTLKDVDNSLDKVSKQELLAEITVELSEMEEEYSNSPKVPLSDSVAASLLLISSVAQRGWSLGRLSNEEKLIQGDLQELRKLQVSRQYEVWQKQDPTIKH